VDITVSPSTPFEVSDPSRQENSQANGTPGRNHLWRFFFHQFIQNLFKLAPYLKKKKKQHFPFAKYTKMRRW
jgi:hypothetical protein